MNSRSFNLHRDSSNSLTLSNVDELSRSSIPKNHIQESTFTSSIKREIRHFHVVVMQWWQRNVEKSVMHVKSCCFANFHLLLFWRSRCRRCRRMLRSLLSLYVTPAFVGKNNLVPRALFPGCFSLGAFPAPPPKPGKNALGTRLREKG